MKKSPFKLLLGWLVVVVVATLVFSVEQSTEQNRVCCWAQFHGTITLTEPENFLNVFSAEN